MRYQGNLGAMAVRLIAALLLVAFAAAATGCAVSSQLITDLSSYDTADLDAFLNRAAPDIGGVAVFVALGNIVVKDTGYSRFGTGKVVDIGTSARWLAAAAMMTLVDEGLLSLDDPVSYYLPEFGGEKQYITIRQLWSGTSGLVDDSPALMERTITLKECALRIAATPLAFIPGTLVHDGAAGIQVGARICEVISGTLWQQFFHSRIAGPLGMSSTTFDMMGFNRNPRIACAARSTVQDYGQFLVMLLQEGLWNNRRILSESSVAELLHDQSLGAPISESPYAPLVTVLPQTRDARPGLGVWLEQTDPVTGAAVVASCPGDHGFMPWVDLSRNLACVLSAQSDLESASYTITHVRDLVQSMIAKGPQHNDASSRLRVPSSS